MQTVVIEWWADEYGSRESVQDLHKQMLKCMCGWLPATAAEHKTYVARLQLLSLQCMSNLGSTCLAEVYKNTEGYLGPIHCTGLQRCEKTGSVKKVTPAICTKQLACPNQKACTACPAY